MSSTSSVRVRCAVVIGLLSLTSVQHTVTPASTGPRSGLLGALARALPFCPSSNNQAETLVHMHNSSCSCCVDHRIRHGAIPEILLRVSLRRRTACSRRNSKSCSYEYVIDEL